MLEARVMGGRTTLGQRLFTLCRHFIFTLDLVAEIDPLPSKPFSTLFPGN